jgi:hypothetical protein
LLLHALPHVPQWEISLPKTVSQPSVAMPLQSPYPAEHTKPHTPALHCVVLLGR